MKEEKEIGSIPTGNGKEKSRILAFALFVLAIIIGLVAWLKAMSGRRKVLKSKLAEEYGVSTKVLMNWISMLCPIEVKDRYHGTKKKKIMEKDIYPYLGSPASIPLDHKERPVRTRKDICRYLNIEESTLKRRLKEIGEPEGTIGLSMESFKRMRSFPPRQVRLMLDYMHVCGYVAQKG